MGIIAQPRSVWLIPALVLILLLAAMALDFGGAESALAALQTECFVRLQPVADLSARLTRWEAVAALAVAGVAAITLLARFGVLWSALFTLLAIAAAGGAAWYLYAVPHVLFDALALAGALLLVLFSGLIAHRAALARNRGRLQAIFADTLSAETIAHVARRPKLLTLDGESRVVTALSLSLRNFASVGIDTEPKAFAARSQQIFETLIDQARAHGATLGEVSEEGLGCFWNAPLDDPDHALHACEAASGLLETIGRLNESLGRAHDSPPPLQMEIGIATGPAVGSVLQSHGRMRYRATGACAVEAARIRTDRYGPPILATEETAKAAQRGFAFLEVDYIDLGLPRPLRLYAMIGSSVMRASPKFRALSTFHDHIFQTIRSQQWEKARALIAQCRKLSGASQPVYDLHLARIAYYEASPPPATWDGVFRPILK